MPNAVSYVCLIWCLPSVHRGVSVSVWYKSRDWAVILGDGCGQCGSTVVGKELGQVVRAALVPVPSERLGMCVTKCVPARAALRQGLDVQ